MEYEEGFWGVKHKNQKKNNHVLYKKREVQYHFHMDFNIFSKSELIERFPISSVFVVPESGYLQFSSTNSGCEAIIVVMPPVRALPLELLLFADGPEFCVGLTSVKEMSQR